MAIRETPGSVKWIEESEKTITSSKNNNKIQKRTKCGARFKNSTLQYQVNHKNNLWRKRKKNIRNELGFARFLDFVHRPAI
jgi:hypothetical protein